MSLQKKLLYITLSLVLFIIAINLFDFNRLTGQNDFAFKQTPKINKINYLELGRKDIPNDYITDVWTANYQVSLSNNQGIEVNWKTSNINLQNNSEQQSSVNLFLYAQDNTNHTHKVQFTNIATLEGNTVFAMPDEAGIYEARYLMDSTNYMSLANSGPILIQSPTIKLNITGTSNEKIVSVSWDLAGESYKKEKIRSQTEPSELILCLNLLGAYSECLWSQQLTSQNGVVQVELPEIGGYFIFRILKKSTTWRVVPVYKCLQVTNAFKSSNSLLKLSVFQTQTVIASTLSVSWNIVQNQKFDWIGLYKLSSHSAFLRSETPLVSIPVQSKNGTWDTILPPNSQAGPFIFVYYSKHVPIAVSDIIVAHQPNVKCPKDNQTQTKIKHLVLIVVENHTFDNYFGRYCKAKVNSNPSCTEGPECCEKSPEIVEGFTRYNLTNTENMIYDPDHQMDCELCELNGRKMDGYLKGCFCSNPKNFAFAHEKLLKIYYDFASNNSLADNYFQASAGDTCQNNMYLARASFVYKDCTKGVLGSPGQGCYFYSQPRDFFELYYDPSLTTLLDKCNFVVRTYPEGWNYAKEHFTENPCWPNGYTTTDTPLQYYAGVSSNPQNIADYTQLETDIINKSLPDVIYVKPLGIRTGHPEAGPITPEVDFVNKTVNLILESDYYNDTLILYTADESGGFYDHKIPPETSKVDNIPYGPRIPMMAIGKFAKRNYISHVLMEHSSVVKFVEYNWLNGESGQLNTRDAEVNNILDLIDMDVAALD